MACIKRWISQAVDKPTLMLISGVWTAASAYITQVLASNIGLTTFVVTAGNLVIVWLTTEAQNGEQTA